MIISRLAGGLGNQMFHYATARGCQRRSTEQIVLDHRLLCPLEKDIDKIIQRPYALSIFRNLKATLISSELINIFNRSGFSYKLKYELFKRQTVRIEQEVMRPLHINKISAKNIHLVGNFQSEKYFTHIREEILNDFVFPELDPENELVKLRILESNDSISLHIRRGDYHSVSNSQIFTSVNLHYYKKALELISQKIESYKLNIFVFSDDTLWVKENLTNPNFSLYFVEGNNNGDSWKDMYLMSLCDHHIIANSSFSWWGCWLSKSTGIKIAPRHWFHLNTYEYDINDIIPKNWTILDYPIQPIV